MKQKQRDSDRHKTRVKVTLKAKDISIKNKIIKLEPIIEAARNTLENSPREVSEITGMLVGPCEIELSIFDSEGYRLANEKRGRWNKETPYSTGIFDHEYKDISIDSESLIRAIYSEDKNGIEYHARLGLIRGAWHELIHLYIYEYKPESVEWCEIEKSCKKMSNPLLRDIRCWMHYLIKTPKRNMKELISEGIAYWGEDYLVESHFGNEYRRLQKGENTNPSENDIFPELSLPKKLMILLKDKTLLGYWFVEEISKRINTNPIKVIIDNIPKSYIELLYPERYLKRLKNNE